MAYDRAWASGEEQCSSCEREGNKLITSVLLSHFRPHQFSIIPINELKAFELNPLYLFCVHWTHRGHLDVSPGIWICHFKDKFLELLNLRVIFWPFFMTPAVRKGWMSSPVISLCLCWIGTTRALVIATKGSYVSLCSSIDPMFPVRPMLYQ